MRFLLLPCELLAFWVAPHRSDIPFSYYNVFVFVLIKNIIAFMMMIKNGAKL